MIYEILYIIPSKFSDSEIEGVQGRVNAILEKNEAKVERTDNLGKIKLAYSIKKEKHGTYILNFIEVAGANIAKIDQDLRLHDEVLRHVIVKREKGIPLKTSEISTYVEPITSEGKRMVKEKKKEPVRTETQKPQEKISTKELDKKLDEILESDIVSGV